MSESGGTFRSLRTSYACEYLSGDQSDKINERLLEIGRLFNGMIEKSSAFVIGDDRRLREDPAMDEFLLAYRNLSQISLTADC